MNRYSRKSIQKSARSEMQLKEESSFWEDKYKRAEKDK